MPNLSKIVERLDITDFTKHPIWRFGGETARGDDRRVRPVSELPVRSLVGCLVGTRVSLANGEQRWAVLGNINLANPKRTKHFLTIWIENRGKWFEMARYFDVDYKRRGPQQMADFLALPLTAVFPITYDISSVAEADSSVLRGAIESDPKDRLTEDDLIALTLADD